MGRTLLAPFDTYVSAVAGEWERIGSRDCESTPANGLERVSTREARTPVAMEDPARTAAEDEATPAHGMEEVTGSNPVYVSGIRRPTPISSASSSVTMAKTPCGIPGSPATSAATARRASSLAPVMKYR